MLKGINHLNRRSPLSQKPLRMFVDEQNKRNTSSPRRLRVKQYFHYYIS